MRSPHVGKIRKNPTWQDSEFPHPGPRAGTQTPADRWLDFFHCVSLKVIYARFPLAGIDVIVKFGLTCSPLTYSMALDAYHIDSVNTCYD